MCNSIKRIHENIIFKQRIGDDVIKTNIAKIAVAFALFLVIGVGIVFGLKNLFHITLHNKTQENTTVTTVTENTTKNTKKNITTMTNINITTTSKTRKSKEITTTINEPINVIRKITDKTVVTTINTTQTKILKTTVTKQVKKPKETVQTTIHKSSNDFVYLGIFRTTAYYADPSYSRGITASGARCKENHTISAGRQFKFGTKLMINGIVYTVEDRGSAVHGNVVDIYFNTYDECVNYGVKNLKVYLVK